VEELEYTVDEEIADVRVNRPHVVILGAGASRASFPQGDRHGRALPLMNDLVATLGLEELLLQAGINPDDNFESIYSGLAESATSSTLLFDINARLETYFSLLELPDGPTIYDELVLSLRSKDIIATFNWDPLLWQAMLRNHEFADMPTVVYLHGNVAIGYCSDHKTKGMRSGWCSVCRNDFIPSRLLYPVLVKGYMTDPFISMEWTFLQSRLKAACMLTIFGYAAPDSDVEAIELMSAAWGNVNDRNMEQVEIIDIRPHDELRDSWSRFVHTHHYEVHEAFHQSWIANHPRRTGEAWWAQFFEAKFVSEHRIPRCDSLAELQRWFEPLLLVEPTAQ
jgi:hypothetical protein